MKVKAMFDNEGHTETEIKTEEEITKVVEKWLEKNDFDTLLIKEGVFRENQTFGIKNTVKIDTRDGEIFTAQDIPGQGSFDEPFYITLVSIEEMELEDDIADGVDLIIELTPDVENKLKELNIDIEDLEIEDGKIDYRKNESKFDSNLESFIKNFMTDEDWDEWVETYSKWQLEERCDDWKESIEEYYNQLALEDWED